MVDISIGSHKCCLLILTKLVNSKFILSNNIKISTQSIQTFIYS